MSSPLIVVKDEKFIRCDSFGHAMDLKHESGGTLYKKFGASEAVADSELLDACKPSSPNYAVINAPWNESSTFDSLYGALAEVHDSGGTIYERLGSQAAKNACVDSDLLALCKDSLAELEQIRSRDGAVYDPTLTTRLTMTIASAESEPTDGPRCTPVAAAKYPDEPIGHHGKYIDGVVVCSFCHAPTKVEGDPPFTVTCAGCLRQVRIEPTGARE